MKKVLTALLLAAAALLTACTVSVPAPEETAPDTSDEEVSCEETSSVETSDVETTVPEVPSAKITDYAIVYPSSGEGEVGKDAAEMLADVIESSAGVRPVTHNDKTVSEHEIVIGKCARAVSRGLNLGIADTFEYYMKAEEGNVYITGGSSFALAACFEMMKETYFDKNAVPADGDYETGSAYGKELFPLSDTDGATLRLMSNNTWNCDDNKEAWIAMGDNCSYIGRYKGLAAVYMAYRPDVICFQEMTAKMIRQLLSELSAHGYDYSLLTYTQDAVTKPYTCIIYRGDRLELIEQGHHDFAYGNDANSKGYTWGRFKVKATGKEIIVLSTHLWWKSETSQAGSNKWREDQAAEIVAEINRLIGLYGCPCYVMGDFNTQTTSAAFKVFTDGGFADCFDIAKLYADDVSGHHKCDASGYSREDPVPQYKGKGIDHIIVKNAGSSEVLVFNHIRPLFYIRISDHYPLYVDIKY